MNKLLDFIKGIPIGIANVIPGFSGGTMAVIMNIYERFIKAFSEILQHPIKVLKDAWALFLGLFVGVIIAISLIAYLLTNFPIPTSMFFIGLILGSIPKMFEKTRNEKIKYYDVIIFFICIITVVAIPILGYLKEGSSNVYTMNVKMIILIFFLSIIAASAMVIPGVSGSMILLALGYYDVIWVGVLDTFIKAVLAFNFDIILKTLLPVSIFGFGVLFGVVFISKIIKMLLQKYSKTVYVAILGLLVASPFAILFGAYKEYKVQFTQSSWIHWIVGILTMILGTISVNYLTKFEKADE